MLSWSRYIGATICVLLGAFVSGCQQKAVPLQAGPTEVAYVTMRTDKVVLTTDLPGRTSAYLVAEIRPQVSGLLQKRLFKEGSSVKAGDILYQIDPVQYQAAYDQAKAALSMSQADITLAEANLPAIRSRAERLKGLAAIHAVGQQEHDDASAALSQAEANLGLKKTAVEVNKATMESSRINLSFTPIKAPISGRIGISNITVGAMVTAYQAAPLAVIQQIDPIYVDVTQANAQLLSLRKSLERGDLKRGSTSRKKVKLLLEDGTQYDHAGDLQFQDVTVDQTTGSVTLRLVFANPRQVLLPGTFVRAVVEEGANEQAILIPQEGVGRDPKGNPIAMLVTAENKVEQRALTLDRAIKDKWLVAKGLAPGDKVIVEGAQKVRAGDAIKPISQDVPAMNPQSSAAVK